MINKVAKQIGKEFLLRINPIHWIDNKKRNNAIVSTHSEHAE